MKPEKTLLDLHDRILEIKRVDRNADVTALILATIQDTHDNDIRAHMYATLASEYHLLGRLKEAEDALNRVIALAPDRPEPWINLAEHYHYHAIDLRKALAAIQTAIENGRREGNFVRQALGVRIRISLEMEDYGSVERTLRELMVYKPKPGSIDVDVESDFLKRIPTGKIEKQLLDDYIAAVNR